jgi:large subunit ribosomal protein L14
MIQKGSYLNVIDNSGAKIVCCFHLFNGFRKRYGSVGSLILVSIKSLRARRKQSSKVKKGEIFRAVIVRTAVSKLSVTGTKVFCKENGVVLLNKHMKPIGTRIFGTIFNSIRFSKFLKIVSLSSGVVL